MCVGWGGSTFRMSEDRTVAKTADYSWPSQTSAASHREKTRGRQLVWEGEGERWVGKIYSLD